MLADKITESVLGTASLGIAISNAILAQAGVPHLDGLLSIITSIGGPGLAVWLVYYHTTTTIPNAQKEFREERAEILAAYEKQMDQKREDFKRDIEAIVEKSYCRFKG